jgi:hypothetical protein
MGMENPLRAWTQGKRRKHEEIKHPKEKLEIFSWLKDKGTWLFFNKEVWRELPSAF